MTVRTKLNTHSARVTTAEWPLVEQSKNSVKGSLVISASGGMEVATHMQLVYVKWLSLVIDMSVSRYYVTKQMAKQIYDKLKYYTNIYGFIMNSVRIVYSSTTLLSNVCGPNSVSYLLVIQCLRKGRPYNLLVQNKYC